MKKGMIQRLKQKHYKQNFIVLFIGFLLICGLSVGYSVVNQNLAIQSRVVLRADKDIRVVEVLNTTTSCGHDLYNPNYTENSVTINGELPSLDCELQYTVKISNMGTKTMELTGIDDDVYNNSDIKYQLHGLEMGEKIEPSTDLIFTITLRYNSSLEVLPSNINIGAIFEFVWQEYIVLHPLIILNPEYVEIARGTAYDVMTGVSAVDPSDGDITSKVTYVSNIKETILGSYQVIYSVENSNGIRSTATRDVKVIDIIPPVITPTGSTNRELLIYDELDLKTLVTASDNIDGDITGKVSIDSQPSFHNKIPGVYKITYTVADSSGNFAAPITITVTVFDFIKISGGYYHSLALSSHGKVYVWGQNTYGQLGLGDATRRTNPTYLSSLSNVIDIAAGEGSSYAVTSDGAVYSWGYNGVGRLGTGNTTNKNVPTQIMSLNNIIQIDTSYSSVIALTKTGNVYTWGYGAYGVLGLGNDLNQYNPTLLPITDVKSVRMGPWHAGALKSNGELYLWGTNLEGEIGNGTTGTYNIKPTLVNSITDVKDFSCGGRHTLAVTNSGNLYSWGFNSQGQLGDNSVVTRSSATPILINANINYVSAGYEHSIAVDNTGKVYTWGYNTYGKLGLNDITRRLVPTANTYQTNGKLVDASFETSFIVTNNGRIYGMGLNNEGIIGDGTTSTDRRIPTLWNFTYTK